MNHSSKKMIITIVLVMASVIFPTFSWAEDAPAAEAPKMGGTFGGYIGYFTIAGSGNNDTGKLTLGLCASFDISPTISVVGRFNTYSVGSGNVSVAHNFYDVGLATSGFGAGVSFTSLGEVSGTGFFIEWGTHDPGVFLNIRWDIVSIETVAVGGISINVGYTFGI